MSALPWQTSVSPQNIASGTAHSFFLPAGGVVPPPPPPPSTISTLANIQVSTLTFGDTTGGFPTSGMIMYKSAAATSGGSSSTIIAAYEGSVGHGSISVDRLGLMQNLDLVGATITNTSGALTVVDNIQIDNACTLTVSSLTCGGIAGAGPYIVQPLTHFGQGVLGAGASTIVTIPRNDTSVYAISLGGCPSTVVLARQISTFIVGGPAGSNFSWITVTATQ